MTIWIIRHPQSQSNAGQATTSPDDNGLSELGLLQAQCVADARSYGDTARVALCPDWIATSPYWRTQLTAQSLLEKFPQVKSEIWQVREFTYLSFPLN